MDKISRKVLPFGSIDNYYFELVIYNVSRIAGLNLNNDTNIREKITFHPHHGKNIIVKLYQIISLLLF